MMKHMAGAIAALLMMLGCLSMTGQDNIHQIDRLELSLRDVRTSSDSVDILFNILDLSVTPDARAQALKRLFAAARNANDTIAQLDAIMYKTNVVRNDTAYLSYMMNILDDMPQTPRVKGIRLFIRLYQINNLIDNDTSESLDGVVSRLMQRYSREEPEDDYEHVEVLYEICTRLERIKGGSLLEKYYEKLCSLVAHMNLPAGAVRYLIYMKAAEVFTLADNPKLAVEIDRRTLSIVDSMATLYRTRGRKLAVINDDSYLLYRRLLLNHKALHPEAVERYYSRICDLMAMSPELKEKFENNYAVTTYYNMAKKNYTMAIECILKGIDQKTNQPYRYYFLRDLLEAATATGRKDLQLKAALELNRILNEKLDAKTQEKYRELQLVYNINALQEDNARLEREQQEASLRFTHIIMIVSGVALLLLLVIVGLLLWQNIKTRRRVAEKAASALRLQEERNKLEKVQDELIKARDNAKSAERIKTDFINSMSHEIKTPLTAISEYSRLIVDCMPEERRKYLEKFANIIDMNTRIVLTLMNDVLDISSLECNTMHLTIEPVQVQPLCTMAIDTVFEGGKSEKPIEVIFNPDHKADKLILTDGQRVAQVLVNLLSNAQKFTEKGKIILDYDVASDGKSVTFTVTDTGQGIPAGKEKEIFERFIQLDHSAGGTGLGLYISALLARLLKGSIEVDKKYRRGARFVFTIPV